MILKKRGNYFMFDKLFNRKVDDKEEVRKEDINELVALANQNTKKAIIDLIDKKITKCRNFKLPYSQRLGMNQVIKEIEEEFNVGIFYINNATEFIKSDTVELNIVYHNIEDIKEITKREQKQLIETKLNSIRKKINESASEGYSTLSVFIEDNILKEISNTLESEGYKLKPSLTKQIINQDCVASELWVISWE